jgi:hypothetical protein
LEGFEKEKDVLRALGQSDEGRGVLRMRNRNRMRRVFEFGGF